MFTNNRLQRHWNEVALFIKKEWPQFTNEDLKEINGDYDRFAFLLKDLYGGFPKLEAEARTKLQILLNRLDEAHPERVQLHQ